MVIITRFYLLNVKLSRILYITYNLIHDIICLTGGFKMLNSNAKYTLTIFAFDKTGRQLESGTPLPILDPNNFDLPIQTNHIAIFRYCESHKITDGDTLFLVYIGKEMLAEEAKEYLKNGGKVDADNLIFPKDQSDIWSKRLLYKVDSTTGTMEWIEFLNEDDRVVDDLVSLNAFAKDLSVAFDALGRSIKKIKTLGKKSK